MTYPIMFSLTKDSVLLGVKNALQDHSGNGRRTPQERPRRARVNKF